MVFFQVMLLAGYAYAHATTRLLAPRGQMILHLLALVAALAMLPIIPAERWMPDDADQPTLRILGLLTATVGAPYFVLASTGPLLSAWFSRVWPGRSPYRLYALSNAASLLALLSYPFIFEPNLTRPAQARLWSILMGVFAVLCAAVAVLVAKAPRHESQSDAADDAPHPWLLWLVLPAIASALLLAMTNKICQEVAVVPLLWVVPLTLYLLSFIIAFDSPRWYRRDVWYPMLGASLIAVCFLLYVEAAAIGVMLQLCVYCLALFVCCMVCHGELYRRRPGIGGLTAFYLMIAAGGAAGGIFVALLAPHLFNGYFELHLSLFATAAIAAAMLLGDDRVRRGLGWSFAALALGVGVSLTISATRVLKDARVLARSRNFYGVLAVYEVSADNTRMHHRIMQHGGVAHGLQFYLPSRRDLPTAYYAPDSGVGITLRAMMQRSAAPLNVGIVGLGAGTVAVYSRELDRYRFYEINPDVLRLAEKDFSFLHDARGRVETVLGDARLSLARETDLLPYDLLILDAFSGDSIPVHLLTRECFELYLKRLRPGGVIAVHISNQHLDFAPVLLRVTEHFGLHAAQIISRAQPEAGEYLARWMILSADPALVQSPPISTAASPVSDLKPSVRLWTDDDTNLFQIME
jgi:hypothetical protein